MRMCCTLTTKSSEAVKRIKKRGRFCFVCVKHPQSKHPDDSEDNMKTGHMLKFLLQTGGRTCDSSVSIRPLEEEHVVNYTNPHVRLALTSHQLQISYGPVNVCMMCVL